MNFIETTESPCECCDEPVTLYHIPLPMDSVTFNPEDKFCLHLNEDEMQVLYLAMKEHLMGLADVQPVE